MVLIGVVFIFVVEVWGLDAIINNKDCSKIGSQSNCQRVLGCYWESDPANTSQSGSADIAIGGGQCMKDQCLRIVDPLTNCGSFPYYENTRNCFENTISAQAEHKCVKNDIDAGSIIECGATCSSGNCGPCHNSSNIPNDLEKICFYRGNPQNGCALQALISGSCSSGEKQLMDGRKKYFNCKEVDIDGVSTCVEVSGCEAVGVDACTYDPSCMVVDGRCVTDNCFSSSTFSIYNGHCDISPEVCTEHKFRRASYEYTYQSEIALPYNYMSYKRKYYDEWYCTNKNYNPQPNTYAFLDIIDEKLIDAANPVYDGPQEILNYKYAGEDRCVAGVSRDLCQWCPEFKKDDSECTEAGGHVVTVKGVKMCSNDRPSDEDAASILYSPSITFLFALLAAFVAFMN